MNLSDLNNDGGGTTVTKQLLYAQTNPSNAHGNTVEHRFVTLAQVPTITKNDSIDAKKTSDISILFIVLSS